MYGCEDPTSSIKIYVYRTCNEYTVLHFSNTKVQENILLHEDHVHITENNAFTLLMSEGSKNICQSVESHKVRS
jgi:hypothetical protein